MSPRDFIECMVVAGGLAFLIAGLVPPVLDVITDAALADTETLAEAGE